VTDHEVNFGTAKKKGATSNKIELSTGFKSGEKPWSASVQKQ